ncbi:MAG: Uma2 family endonuclease [Kineosporiaceae bacterium]
MDTGLAVQLWSVSDLPDDENGPRHELIDGSLHVTPLASWRHQRVVDEIVSLLRPALSAGHELAAPANVQDGPHTLAIPDVVVARAGDYHLGPSPQDVILLVEVLSPSTRITDLHAKRALYRLRWGVPYWIVDPEARSVWRFGGGDYASIDLPAAGFAVEDRPDEG